MFLYHFCHVHLVTEMIKLLTGTSFSEWLWVFCCSRPLIWPSHWEWWHQQELGCCSAQKSGKEVRKESLKFIKSEGGHKAELSAVTPSSCSGTGATDYCFGGKCLQAFTMWTWEHNVPLYADDMLLFIPDPFLTLENSCMFLRVWWNVWIHG